VAIFAVLLVCLELPADSRRPSTGPKPQLRDLIAAIRAKAEALESSSGTRSGFGGFTSQYELSASSVSYSDFSVVRLVYEAARDAGFWNMHWSVTDRPPNSDAVWRQWRKVTEPSYTRSTATAECDELSALFAFLVERAGVRSVGLFWPYLNHTVAVWVLHPAGGGAAVRVVIPTSQIFLEESDDFGTRKFNPWTQKTIYEYTRRDAPDTFELPKPLFDFFLAQMDKYGGASDATLQHLRYLREAVFLKSWAPETAASEALRLRASLSHPAPEDIRALEAFAQDMRH